MIPAVLPVYKRFDVAFERGEGGYLYDTTGKRYLDCIAGVAVHAFGHAHPRLLKTLNNQAAKLGVVSHYVRIAEMERAAEKLVAASGFANTVFFGNSGVEAWECGLKIIRRHFWAKGEGHKNRVITFNNAFHGRTIAAISAVKRPIMVDGFAPLDDGFDQVPFGDLVALEAAITPQTAAICLEPVQGEGGIKPASIAFLQGIRALCDKHGLLLFLDEIQCGMGRSGKMWAYQYAGIKPDVMATAKALGGGFPVGACLATEHAASAMTYGVHGTTYGGNPIACAMVCEVLDMMAEPGVLDHVTRMGDYLDAGLQKLVAQFPALLASTRGLGLMRGVELTAPDYKPMQEALLKNGLFTGGSGQNVIRFLPPLNITEAQIDEALAIFSTTCQDLSR